MRAAGNLFCWNLRTVMVLGVLAMFFGCAVGRPGLSKESAHVGAVHVLVDKGFRAEWVDGPGVVIVPDENCGMPRSFSFVFGTGQRWKVDGLRERLLRMGALRVDVE